MKQAERFYSQLLATGAALPATSWSNAALQEARGLETSDAWIRQRTGIAQRHILGESESVLDLAIEAGRQALHQAHLQPADIDGVLVATCTPDRAFPSMAARVQAALGATQAFAMDLNAACAGFVYAWATADAYIRAGLARRILLVAAEHMTQLLDWQDRSTAVLFGDGAGAAILQAGTVPGTLWTHLEADGRQAGRLYVDDQRHIVMQGKEVYKAAVSHFERLYRLAENAVGPIDWLIPHQANLRIMEAVAERIGLDSKQLVITVDSHANTSAASIPLALHHFWQQHKARSGDKVALLGFGAGWSMGCAVYAWP